MEFDIMVGPNRWSDAAELAVTAESAGFSGLMFTETGQTPWMSIAAAAMAAPSLTYSTGIAVAFPMSPMVAASLAWELADNTQGQFRLGLGSQVRAHIERRYGMEFDPPVHACAIICTRKRRSLRSEVTQSSTIVARITNSQCSLSSGCRLPTTMVM